MMFRDPELVRQVIRGQGLTIGAAWDTARRDKLYLARCEDPADLVKEFDQVLALMSGPFRWEAWGKDYAPEAGGRKSVGRDAFVWILMGAAGGHQAEQQQPIAQITAPAPAAIDIDLHVRLAKAEAELAWMRLEKERMQEEAEAPAGDGADQFQLLRELITVIRTPSVPAPTGAITGKAGTVSSDQDFIAALDRMAAEHPDQVSEYRKQILAAYGHEQTK